MGRMRDNRLQLDASMALVLFASLNGVMSYADCLANICRS